MIEAPRICTDMGVFPMTTLRGADLRKYIDACTTKARECWAKGVAFELPTKDDIDAAEPVQRPYWFAK